MTWLFFQSSADTTTSASTEKTMRIETFHSEAESANRPNAAPLFWTWVRRKNPGRTTMLSFRVILLATSHLETWSATTTRMAMRKWYFLIACGIPMGSSVRIR